MQTNTQESTSDSQTPKNQIAQAFLCPITLEVMKDPVIDKEGNSYEKSAILEWLQTHDTSPMTRRPLSAEDLSPNRALKDLLDQYHKDPTSVSLAPIAPLTQPTGSVVQQLGIVPESKIGFIKITSPKAEKRTPINLVCVVDVSGSMSVNVEIPDSKEVTGLTVLDIVKHAVLTIIEVLGPDDKFSLVSFSSTAKLELELSPMDNAGKSAARTAVKRLETISSTNLWAGLHLGLSSLKSTPISNSAVLVLTDGIPNVDPPRGILPTLNRFLKQNPLNCTIHTIGFGYSLLSDLLVKIALRGNGSYSFIPDSSLTGTIFINLASDLLANKAHNTLVTITPTKGTNLDLSFVPFPYTQHQDGSYTIRFGSLTHGTDRHIVFKYKSSDSVNVGHEAFFTVDCRYEDSTTGRSCVAETLKSNHEPSLTLIQSHIARCRAIQTIRSAMDHVGNNMDKETLKESHQKIMEVIKDIKSLNIQSDYINDLLIDLSDQVATAFSKLQYYSRWGRHYLPSLSIAHAREMCNNFKDPGVQHYSGELFSKLQDFAEQIFLTLPPPTPSHSVYSSYGSSPGGGYSGPTNMASFYNASNPCFAGWSTIELSNGSSLPISQLAKGHKVRTCSGVSKVACIIKTIVGTIPMVVLPSGLCITPWHPIRISGSWIFPCSISAAHEIEVGCIYSIVLESSHSCFINSIECVTLGHSFQEKNVKHQYFGTQRIISDLKSTGMFQSGLIILKSNPFFRGPDNRINGLKPDAIFHPETQKISTLLSEISTPVSESTLNF